MDRRSGGSAEPNRMECPPLVHTLVNLINKKTSHEKKYYNTKIIHTKSNVELWRYKRPIKIGYSKDTSTSNKSKNKKGYERVESLIKRKNYYKNRQNEVRRIVDLNFDDKTSFLTLTQDSKEPFCKDIKVSNYNFDKFIRRLKYYLEKNFPDMPLKYLATWERTKSGLIHYHVILFSFPFIPTSKIEELWRLGFVKINKIKKIDSKKRGLYISKYFSKDLDKREYKSKAYFKSRNLKVPKAYKIFIPDEKFSPNQFGEPSYSSQYKLMAGQDLPVDVNYYFV